MFCRSSDGTDASRDMRYRNAQTLSATHGDAVAAATG
jgi:hypothetical protein